MKRLIASFAAIAMFSGCAGINKSMEYASDKSVTIDGVMIFDKPAENRMLLTATFGGGVAAGSPFGTKTGVAKYEAVANKFLASRGCSVQNVTTVLAPTNFEARYKC